MNKLLLALRQRNLVEGKDQETEQDQEEREDDSDDDDAENSESSSWDPQEESDFYNELTMAKKASVQLVRSSFVEAMKMEIGAFLSFSELLEWLK